MIKKIELANQEGNLEIRVYDKKNKVLRSFTIKSEQSADEMRDFIKSKLGLK